MLVIFALKAAVCFGSHLAADDKDVYIDPEEYMTENPVMAEMAFGELLSEPILLLYISSVRDCVNATFLYFYVKCFIKMYFVI